MTSDCPVSFFTTNNEKIVQFNFEGTLELQNGRWSEFSHYLKEAFKIERNDNGDPKNIVISEEVLLCLNEWLNLIITQSSDLIPDTLEVITEILRSLRNCISSFKRKKYVVENTNILITCDILFTKLIEVDKNNLCLKILLQFLINLISSCKEAAEYVHRIFYEKIKLCLKNCIHVYETSALIYNISLTVTINDIEVMNLIFDTYSGDGQNEFLNFFLENNISSNYFWNMYEYLKTENKITTLEILRHMQLQKTLHHLPITGLEVLTNRFLNSADTIFQIKQEEDDIKIYEVSLILEILSSLSGDDSYLQKLQDKKEILINAGVLLINIHRLGKVSENCFTPVQKLSEFKTSTELNEHPAFGFKADLVRLIGNLCWKNMELQNLARTAELIPVILDCCNMDARNPFIIQWAILGVRNLCENNKENQKLIAGLHQEGTVSSALLGELGITLHRDGDSCLNIVPLDSLSNVKKIKKN